MVQVTLTDTDFKNIDALSLDDLYANLAIAEAGTDPSFSGALGSMSSIRALAEADGTKSLFSLINLGKSIFNRLWPAVKAIVCKIYSENDGDTDLKGWVAAAATAVATLLGIAGPIAALIIAIAMKLGLDAVCAADASLQPA